jgi:hypothetical protein
MARPGIVFYFEFLPAFEKMDPAEVGGLFLGAMRYAQTGEVPEFEGVAAIVWELVRPGIDRDAANYEEKVALSRWKNYVKSCKKDGLEPLDFEKWKNSCESLGTIGNQLEPNGSHGDPTPTPTSTSTSTSTTISIEGGKPPTRSKQKTEKVKYGQYQNVLLGDAEMEALREEFPSDYEKRIERLSEYMASTGKKYKSHLAVMRSWARRDTEKATATAKKPTLPNYEIQEEYSL